ncbi:MAG TPA: DUF86 domain-containing protein [Vicinamibacterales bacterium]|jgi:uncharacterized protein YutE (UPF0331/DUF86 family)|nr:DUF86 domain-containing protein [Vicinamibacterales bacterium]
MTIDHELITRKLLLITADLEPLRTLYARGLDAFLASALEQASVERLLERTVTRMIDINYHVLTASGHPPPADYHSSFLNLRDLGVLDAAFASQIARSAGLRNRLVHDYEDLDPRKIFEALGTALHDVPIYLSQINNYVKQNPHA